MQTETEKLKESRDKQYATERFTELLDYTKELHTKADAEQVLVERARKLELLALATWFVTIFFGTALINELAWLVLILLIIRNVVFLQSTLMQTVNELKGIYKALELLGMLPPSDKKGRKEMKKYKRSLIAERWARLKSKLRKEAYA